jgi:hypothetical protein
MKKEFITYDQAAALKELGFDEKCFCYFDDDKELRTCVGLNNWNQHLGFPYFISVQLYQHAFRFFRDNHQLFYTIETNCSQLSSEWGFDYTIYDKGNDKWLSTEPQNCPPGETTYKTYEEAESDCLNKLIKIVNNF